MRDGLERWDALRRLRGEKRTSGRRKGRAWVTASMWRKRLAAALALGPEEAARVAREIVDSLRIAEADAKLLELVNRTEAALSAASPDPNKQQYQAHLEKPSDVLPVPTPRKRRKS